MANFHIISRIWIIEIIILDGWVSGRDKYFVKIVDLGQEVDSKESAPPCS